MGYTNRAIHNVDGVEVEVRTLTGGAEFRVFRDGVSYDVWREETGWFVEIDGQEVGTWDTAEALIEEKFLTAQPTDECGLCGGPLASDGVCADNTCGADDEDAEPTRPYSDRVIHDVGGHQVEVRKIVDEDAYDVFLEGDRYPVWLDRDKGGWFFETGSEAEGPWPTAEQLLAEAFLNPNGY